MFNNLRKCYVFKNVRKTGYIILSGHWYETRKLNKQEERLRVVDDTSTDEP